ncbi:MAG: tRNA (guanosine(46)-N7)-methyltransferase TrmB [Pirellulales bacterium]|nr:tRNA (guanosine(46)-N7)-methyltransferase TrmB [Pirellulales bacterium]
MARRAPRKPSTSLDLSRHFHLLDAVSTPWQQLALFAREAPLEVEVGSGKGLFLASAAAQTPERNFLGIEIGRKYAEAAAARLARARAENAAMLCGDGLRLFREWLPGESLAAVHVYFPDPWWKKRHKKRRVMNEGLIRDIQRTLVGGGTLHFWTDVEEYFQATLELISQVANLSGPIAVEERPAEHDLDYRTHFERRMRLHGEPVYRAQFVKPAAPAST